MANDAIALTGANPGLHHHRDIGRPVNAFSRHGCRGSNARTLQAEGCQRQGAIRCAGRPDRHATMSKERFIVDFPSRFFSTTETKRKISLRLGCIDIFHTTNKKEAGTV